MTAPRLTRPSAIPAAAALALAAGSASAQITNGSFESGNISGWTITASAPAPAAATGNPHSGTWSLRVGSPGPGETPGDSALYQSFFVGSTGLALTFWTRTATVDSISYDWQDAYIQSNTGATLATIFHRCDNAPWIQSVVDLNPYVGQTIRIAFLVHGDNAGDPTSMNVDDVAVGTAPPMGACCLSGLGGCTVTTSGSCVSQGGTYRGDGVTCAAAGCPGPTPGPDVIVGEVWDIANNGTVGTTTAYSVGTDSCNIGTVGVTWVSGNNQHPVITSNLFRLKTVAGAGRFEQLGMSWCKHGFFATNESYCGPCGTGGGDHLGPGGCSDIYDSGLNGSQGNLGPRSEVNATTGAFPYPYILQGTGGTLGKRCQVPSADVDPAQNAGALYFADSHYVVPDDARYLGPSGSATNGLNNVSYRQVSGINGSFPGFSALTRQQSPGIKAWQEQDPAVTLVNAEYTDTTVGVPITARFIVGGKATDLGNGTWHYEYAVYNVNADRSGASFSVPTGSAALSNIGFRAPLYHSGEPYDNTPWGTSTAGGALTWASLPFPSSPPNANALRWATMYNFRFDANAAPATGAVTLGLFKAGTPASITAAGLPVPGGPTVCYVNCDNSTTPPILNVADFTCFLQKFAAGDPYANCDASTVPPVLNVADFTCFLQGFAAGCP